MAQKRALSTSPVLDILAGRPPRLRRGFIVRDRLSSVVSKPARTIALSAPTGFGKTQLMAFWRFEFAAQGRATLWADAEAGQVADLETAIGRWAMSQRSMNRPLALFVDRSERMVDAAAFVAKVRADLGDEALVVIAGRQDHAIQGDDVLLLDQEDLRLTPDESRAWLATRLGGGRASARDDAVAVCAGVPALLNLDADGLAHRSESGDYPLTESRPLMEMYFDHLIQSAVRPDLRPFLTELALLRSINTEVLGGIFGPDARWTFQECRLATPFFKRIGPDEYEMLPVVAEHLLRRGSGDAPPIEFHLRAARWFSAQGEPARAIDHALAAGDSCFAGRLMDSGLLPVVVGGEMKRAYRWLTSSVSSNPPSSQTFCLGAAMAFVFNQDESRALPYLSRLSDDERAVVEALAVSQQDRLDRLAILLAKVRQPDLLPPIVRTCFENLARAVHVYAPSMMAPRKSARLPRGLPNDLTMKLTRSFALFVEATQLLAAGHASGVADIFEPMLRELRESETPNTYLGSIIVSTVAAARHQCGMISDARALLLPWLERIEQHSTSSIWGLGLLTAARIADAMGQFDECLDHLDKLETLAVERNVLRFAVSALAERVRIHARDGHTSLAGFAQARAQEIYAAIARDALMRDPRLEIEILVAKGHLLRSQGNSRELADVLKRARAIASRPRRAMDLAEVVLLSGSPLEFPAGCRSPALQRLGLDEKDEAALRNRLKIAPVDTAEPIAANPTQDVWIVDKAAAIRLTPREAQVLSGLRRRLSNKAIARDVGLSAETVKWYVGKLLTKLGARDRQQAVERACIYGLVAHTFGASEFTRSPKAGAAA